MWLASLRRLVYGKSRSPKSKRSRSQRRRIIPRLDCLEDRIVPATTLTVDAGDYNNATPPAGDYSLVGAITTANQNSSASNPYTISLTKSTYTTGNNNSLVGANALPVITTGANITINGNGSTINGASLARLLYVSTGATVTLEDIKLTGGKASGTAAKGGAIYNSGNLTLKSVVVGGNQAIGGSGQNGEGGGIYSTGGTLTLIHDVIGRAVNLAIHYNKNSNPTTTHKTTTVGASNQALGGAGGSGLGGGLYLAGGTVKIGGVKASSRVTIAGNIAVGGANGNGQGGALYANGTTLTLTNNLIGSKSSFHESVNKSNVVTKATTTFMGSQDKAGGRGGGSAQGGGLYLSGGTVNISGGTLSGQASAAAGAVGGGKGGSGQGGGIYANNTTLTLTNAKVNGDIVAGSGGNGGHTAASKWNGGAGGNAQGGGIFSLNTALTVSRGLIFGNGSAGAGGKGASGTVNHIAGGTGGTAGLAQGGGIYIQGKSLTLSNAASVSDSIVSGSEGGAGGAGYSGATPGAGGAGGAGNNADGGGVFASGVAVTIEGGATVNQNNATGAGGGAGGVGKTSGLGGSGGMGLGGGLFAQGGSVSITGANTAINSNHVTGGGGGEYFGTSLHGGGGVGGGAYGGGVYALGNSVTLNNGVSLTGNQVTGGMGGSGDSGTLGSQTNPGGNGGNAGVGGTAIGGGAYLAGVGTSLQINTSLTSPASVTIEGNTVTGGGGGGGGNAGKGAPGGNGGNAAAGGLAAGGGLAFNGSGNSTPPAINLSAATIQTNNVNGGNGGNGGSGGSGSFGGAAGGNGGNAGAGAVAQGGGLYVNDAALTLTNTTIGQNQMLGGQGGVGGSGARAKGWLSGTHTSLGGNGGNGANGSNGAAAQGGGLYANASTVTLNTATIASNTITGGSGGTGGFGGKAGFGFAANVVGPWGRDHGGAAGNGGNAAAGQGGGVFATGASTVTALNTSVTGNKVYSGEGGFGGGGGNGFSHVHNGQSGGNAGNGGNGGSGQGGGVYINGGAFTFVNSTAATNNVTAEQGGNGGLGGEGGTGGNSGGNGGLGGNGGNASAVAGGGVFATGSTVKLMNATVANNSLTDGAGGAGGGGGNGNQETDGGTANDGAGGNGGNGGNASSGQGAGLSAAGGSLSVINATFAYNAITAGTPGAGGAGGQGVTSHTGLGKTIQDSPNGKAGSSGIAGTDQGGGLYVGASTATLENTILALDTAASDPDVAGTFSSSDDDFIGNGTGSNLANGTNGDNVGQYTSTQLAAFFGALANNGGSTQTIAPTLTSPTFGKGDPTAAGAIASAEGISDANDATDQRGTGFIRVLDNGIDIGALQTQLMVSDSQSTTTVQAGGTLTYTLTVTNSEASTINATLTDVLDPNTTYQSSVTTGWTVTGTPSTLTPGGTLTATISLGAHSSATLSITVTVASNVPGNTVIANTASVTPTGNSAAGARSVTIDATVPGVTYSNITNEVEVRHSAIHPDPHLGDGYYSQKLLIGNDSGNTLTGPIALVLTNLTPGVSLFNATGIVSSGPYAGDPYIDIVSSVESWLAGWRNFLMEVLEFYDASDPQDANSAITYTPVFLEGI